MRLTRWEEKLIISSRSEVNKFVGPSRAKLREFEQKVYLYISLRMSAMLPSNSEKQSMNDVRQRELRLLGSNRLGDTLLEQNLLTSGKFAFIAGSNFNCNVHQYSLDRNISANLSPFFQKTFLGKTALKKLHVFGPL